MHTKIKENYDEFEVDGVEVNFGKNTIKTKSGLYVRISRPSWNREATQYLIGPLEVEDMYDEGLKDFRGEIIEALSDNGMLTQEQIVEKRLEEYLRGISRSLNSLSCMSNKKSGDFQSRVLEHVKDFLEKQ